MEEQDLNSNTLKPQVLIEAEASKMELEHEISVCTDEDRLKTLMADYSSVTAKYEALGGYDYDHRIMEALSGLGLSGIDERSDLSTLSGGEKMSDQERKEKLLNKIKRLEAYHEIQNIV